MAQTARNQLQAVSQSGGRNLKIRIRKDPSGFFKMSADLAENLGRSDIKGEDGYCRNDAFFYVAQVSVAGLGAIGAFIEFADDHGAGELFFPRDLGEPGEVGPGGLRPQ
jgi:hypothetical protein